MSFELHVLSGCSSNLLGHNLALLRIYLDRRCDLCYNAAELVASHTCIMRADGVKLRQTAFVHEQE